MLLFMISLALLAVFGLLRLLFPVRRDALPADFPDFQVLRAKYWRFDLGVLLGLFVGTGVLALGLGYALHALAVQRYAPAAAGALFFIEPSLRQWTTCGALLALPIAGWAMARFIQHWLGHDYPEYRAYYRLKYKFDERRVLPWIRGLFLLAGGALAALFMNWYTAFYNDKIVYCPPGSFSSYAYNYGDVKKLVQPSFYGALEGGATDEAFLIEFSDGRVWDSDISGYSDWQSNAEVLDFVSAHTGIAVEE